MEYKDYYKILGVDKKAWQSEIKKAYRALALQYHPDKNQGNKAAEDKFKLANEANSVLSDVEKRKKYDELGENWQHQGAHQNGAGRSQPFNGASNPFGQGNDTDFSDFFEQFFAGRSNGGGRNQSRKGGNFETEMEISLEEAYAGTHRIIQLENEKLRITTKPGSYDGQQLKIKNKGGKGSDEANRGDLFVRIKVNENAHFIRKGDHLFENQAIDLYTAVLGGDIIVNTLSGKVKVTIAAGTQNGKSIRLKGKGMPIYDKENAFGDLNIQFQVQIPEKLTNQQRTLFESLKLTVT